MVYNFEWDLKKAASNYQKHGVRFEHAATVLNDPRAISIFDDEHSDYEERWLTLGLSANAELLVIHHTFSEVGEDVVLIRIISSRKATKREAQQYAGE